MPVVGKQHDKQHDMRADFGQEKHVSKLRLKNRAGHRTFTCATQPTCVSGDLLFVNFQNFVSVPMFLLTEHGVLPGGPSFGCRWTLSFFSDICGIPFRTQKLFQLSAQRQFHRSREKVPSFSENAKNVCGLTSLQIVQMDSVLALKWMLFSFFVRGCPALGLWCQEQLGDQILY